MNVSEFRRQADSLKNFETKNRFFVPPGTYYDVELVEAINVLALLVERLQQEVNTLSQRESPK